MHLTSTITLIEVAWITIAIAGLIYSLRLRHDAIEDVRARHENGTNSGREDLANMLVTTAALNAAGFAAFLLAGGVAMLIPSSRPFAPRSLAIQLLLVGAELAMAASVWHKQRVRQRVFDRDRVAEMERLAAAASLAAEHIDLNTAAVLENTAATMENTETRRESDQEGI